MTVEDILIGLGYELTSEKFHFRARPLYRDSDNNTSLRIHKESGRFYDYGGSFGGDIGLLVKLTTGGRDDEVQKYLTDFLPSTEDRPTIHHVPEYPLSILNRLLPSYQFYFEKGISIETLKLFKCGLAKSGKLYERIVFPIFNDLADKIIGFAGRDVTNKSPIKWKLINPKKEWSYPFHLNAQVLRETSQVVLVESIGDMLSLWEAGVKNSLVLFGVELTPGVMSKLIQLNIHDIVIATNNEPNRTVGGGTIAAKKIQKTLSSFFDEEAIRIIQPTSNDFGDMSHKEILEWKTKL